MMHSQRIPGILPSSKLQRVESLYLLSQCVLLPCASLLWTNFTNSSLTRLEKKSEIDKKGIMLLVEVCWLVAEDSAYGLNIPAAGGRKREKTSGSGQFGIDKPSHLQQDIRGGADPECTFFCQLFYLGMYLLHADPRVTRFTNTAAHLGGGFCSLRCKVSSGKVLNIEWHLKASLRSV